MHIMILCWFVGLSSADWTIPDLPEPVNYSTERDSLTVYVFLHDECVISQYFTPELTRLYKTYHSKGVGFIGLFPNSTSDAARITHFGQQYQLKFPLEPDYAKEQTLRLGIRVTPEVAIWDHRSDRLLYRGRIDDSYVRVGKRKLHPKSRDVESIITRWLSHDAPVSLIETQAIGCFINFTDSPR